MYALRLGGAMSDKTGTLNGVRFVEGLALLPAATFETLQTQYSGLIHYFKVSYQAQLVEVDPENPHGHQSEETPATPEGEGNRPAGPESAEAETVHGSPNAGIEAGGTGSLSSGDGHENSGLSDSSEWTARQRRIAAALESLDPDNDEHWTQSNLPRVDAVEQIMDDSSVTRQEINGVAPDFIRPGVESE